MRSRRWSHIKKDVIQTEGNREKVTQHCEGGWGWGMGGRGGGGGFQGWPRGDFSQYVPQARGKAMGPISLCTAWKIPFMYFFAGNCAASVLIFTFMYLYL